MTDWMYFANYILMFLFDAILQNESIKGIDLFAMPGRNSRMMNLADMVHSHLGKNAADLIQFNSAYINFPKGAGK